MKDERVLTFHPPKHLIEYRNGVCRLTISQTSMGKYAWPVAATAVIDFCFSSLADGGVYSCLASNRMGSVKTNASLLVPANTWGSNSR